MKEHLTLPVRTKVHDKKKQEQEDQQNLSGMMKSHYNLKNRVHSLYDQAKNDNYRRLTSIKWLSSWPYLKFF